MGLTRLVRRLHGSEARYLIREWRVGRVERALDGCLGALLLSPARTQARVRRRPQAHLLRDIQVPGEPPRICTVTKRA